MLRLAPEWIDRNVKSDEIGPPFQSCGNATALAISGKRDVANSMFLKLQEIPAWPVRVTSLEVLLSLGDLDAWNRCSQRSREMLEEIDQEDDFYDTKVWVMRQQLKYLAGEYADEEQFLQALNGSLWGECRAYYLIGLKLRCQGLDAYPYFQKCVDTKQFWMHQYLFAKALLEIEYGVALPPEIPAMSPPGTKQDNGLLSIFHVSSHITW